MSESNKKIIKGQNLRLFLGSSSTDARCVALATSCQISVQNDLEDISTKDSTGMWSEQQITGKSWTISCDALFAVGADASGNLYSDLIANMINGAKMYVEVKTTTGDNNRTVDSTNTFTLSGSAYITSLDVTAQNKSNSTYSCSLTGDGALTVASAS